MENSIFKDIALCYSEPRLSATIMKTFGCYFKVQEWNMESLVGKWERIQLANRAVFFLRH